MKHIISAKYKCFVLFIEIFIAILLLPLFYNYIPIDKDAATTFYLPSSNKDDVVSALEKSGYTVTVIDRLMLGLIEIPQKGWYTVKPNDHGRFIFFMTIAQRKAKTMNIVVYGGETAEELTLRLANDMKLDSKKLQEKYQILTRFQEADIFARRYTLARKADEDTAMRYLFDLSNAELLKFETKNFSQKSDTFTLKVLLTIASIIQKESNSAKEMPLISSVIHNRLAKNMRLQMDGALNYGKHSHTIITPERIKSDTSYYNTYKHKGLPNHPVGTVTLTALKAAMSPQKNDHLFFMLTAKGDHAFSATYDKHLENVRAFRVYQKEKKKQKEAEEKERKKVIPEKKAKPN